MKARIKNMMNLSDEDRRKLAEYLDYKAVSHIIGKGRHTIHRLVKDGTFEKIGKGRSARIALKSVLAYLEQEREVAEVARTLPYTSLAKAREFARRKRQEGKMRRAVEIVNHGGAAPASASNPTGDPRFEPCVFEGIAMYAFERDEILDERYRAQMPRRYTFSNVRGV